MNAAVRAPMTELPLVNVGPLDLPSTVGADGSQLVAITFSVPWRSVAAVPNVRNAMRGCRVVGAVACRVNNAHQQGVLLRHIRSRTYRLAGPFGVVELLRDETDKFLIDRRQGHHGGPGRCQGSLTVDGYSYPKGRSVTLPKSVLAWATRYGRGVLSQGIRRMATVVGEEMLNADGQLVAPVVDASPSGRGKPGAVKLQVRVYLDDESFRRLNTLGGGNLSAGIRIAHQALAKPRA